MAYFEIKVQPNSEASSDVVLVDRFHPEWKNGVKILMTEKIIQVMEDYTKRISRWSRVSMGLDFSQDLGLTHIVLSPRKRIRFMARARAISFP